MGANGSADFRGMKPVRAGAVVALLALGFFVQAHYLRSYTQPILFGDPGAYFVVGQKLQQAAHSVLAGGSIATAFDSVRAYLYFIGVGSLYGVIDALAPGDIESFRLVLAGLNTLGMLGCFVLARQLSGSYLGGLLGLAAAAVYSTYALEVGRLAPDPATGCLFVWSAVCYVQGVEAKRWPYMVAAGVFLTSGLLIRAQLITFVPSIVASVLVLSAPFWIRQRERRRLAVALAVGCLPVVLLWTAVTRVVGDDMSEVSRLGFWSFPHQQLYPYGFWMFADADGWVGPYGVTEYPFYLELQQEMEARPELATSRFAQLVYTGRFVVSNLWQHSLLVLDNVYRLYERPTNRYKWDYLYRYERQVLYHGVLLVLAIGGAVAFVVTRPWLVGVYFMPLCLALIHGVSTPLPRYNIPVMFILIATAGAFIGWLSRRMWRARVVNKPALVVIAAAAGGSVLLLVCGEGLRDVAPSLARGLRFLASLGFLATPLVTAASLSATARRRALALVAVFGCLVVPWSAHAIRDQRWHQESITLGELGGEAAGAEQHIVLSGEALARIRRATEAFLVFDMKVPDGNLDGWRVEVNGRRFAGSELLGTMPRFGGATVSGGRNRRVFPQWWALPLPPELIPASAPATFEVKLVNQTADARLLRLFGDRFSEQTRIYEGPSFGDWPHLATTKLQHDGDYRIPVKRPLESADTRSFLLAADGSREAIPAVHRIRIVTLASNVGVLAWETGELPEPENSLGFFAYSGNRGTARLTVGRQEPFELPLGSEQDFDREVAGSRLCYRAEPPRGDMAYGGYIVTGVRGPATSVLQSVQFRSGMSVEPMFFSLDRGTSAEALRDLARRCGLSDEQTVTDAVGRVVEGATNAYPEDVGPWTIADVF